MLRTFYCDIGYATFGFISKDGKIVDAAPIVAWMIGKTLPQVKPWLASKGAKIKEITAGKVPV